MTPQADKVTASQISHRHFPGRSDLFGGLIKIRAFEIRWWKQYP
jgi:hypothetical protein